MLALKRLDILDLESLNVQIVQTQQSNSVVQIETQTESMDKVCTLLQSSSVIGESACAQLDVLVLGVDSALQLQVLDQRRVNLRPCVLQRSPAVRRYSDFAGFGADVGVCGLLGSEEWLRVDGHGCVFGLLSGVLDGGSVGGADEHLVVFAVGCDGGLIQVLSDFLGGSSLEGSWCGHDENGPERQTTRLSICVLLAIRFWSSDSGTKVICVVGRSDCRSAKRWYNEYFFAPSGSKSLHNRACQAQGGEQSLDQSLSPRHIVALLHID
jgi:hypothetical protein